MELFELIQTLNRAHGPSGDEGEIREVIRALAETYATRSPQTPWAA